MKTLLILILSLPFTINTIAQPQPGGIPFEPENKDGFVLPGTLEEFNKDLVSTCFHKIPRLERVKILSATKIKYYQDSNECHGANFLNIAYKGKTFIVCGKDIYKIDGQKPLYTITTTSPAEKHYELYSATSYAVGAADSMGLTFCPDYSIMVLRLLPNGPYTLIDSTDGYHRYTVLRHDDGEYDTVSTVKTARDTIILVMGVQAQMATLSYNLKLLYNKKLSKAWLTDYIEKSGDMYYDDKGKEIKPPTTPH
jgi:hypothetical protein